MCLKVSPDEAIFLSILRMLLKACDKLRNACEISCNFSQIPLTFPSLLIWQPNVCEDVYLLLQGN